MKQTLLASAAAAGMALSLAPVPVQAQTEARLERIEAQLRALQRQVFPGGDQRYFEPEITPAQTEPSPQPVGTPSASALTDVLARLDAIEAELARLTAASEVNANALGQLEARVEALHPSAPPETAATAPDDQPTGVIEVGEGEDEIAPAPAGPAPERVAAVQEIAKPVTDDKGEDEYTYGFRLWDAGFFPEAQQQLTIFLEKYPDHWRTTYGRNLLGRAYLDGGEPRRAATYFFENYQSDKQAARAPDSLLYLAEAMIALGDTNRACIALAEFGDTYPALAVGRLKGLYDGNRNRVDCN